MTEWFVVHFYFDQVVCWAEVPTPPIRVLNRAPAVFEVAKRYAAPRCGNDSGVRFVERLGKYASAYSKSRTPVGILAKNWSKFYQEGWS